MPTDTDQVQEFLRTRGATLCPPAYAAPCQGAVIPDDDAKQHAARGIDPMGDEWRKKPRSGWARYWDKKRKDR